MCCSAPSQDVSALASSLLDDYFSKDVLDEEVLVTRADAFAFADIA